MEQNNLIFTILAVVAIVFALAIIVLAIIYFKKRNKKGFKGIKIAIPVVILAILLAVCVFFLYQYKSYLKACNIALSKGAEQEYIDLNYTDVNNIDKLLETNNIMPDDQSSQALEMWKNKNLTEGDKFLLYRYDCTDCRSLMPVLVQENSGNDHFWFVSSRTDAGKELIKILREEYNLQINSVPCLITYHTQTGPTCEELG